MVQLISNFMLVSTESRVTAYFLVHFIETCVFNHSTHVFNHSTRVFKFVACHGFILVCTRALTRAACIVNMLPVLIARYVFTRVCCVHYLSSSNSPVNVRTEKHIRQGYGTYTISDQACENQPFERKLH